jgi:hypothetical protein
MSIRNNEIRNNSPVSVSGQATNSWRPCSGCLELRTSSSHRPEGIRIPVDHLWHVWDRGRIWVWEAGRPLATTINPKVVEEHQFQHVTLPEPIFLDDFRANYPGYIWGIWPNTPGWRILLFLDDFVNTPGKVANPSGTLGCFIPRVDPRDFKRPWGKSSQQCT